MTQVRQINQTQATITVFDELCCETLILTVVAEDQGNYAVQYDDVAYVLVDEDDGGDRRELSPQSRESIFDGPDTRYVVVENGDGTRWAEVVYVTIGEWGPGHIVCDARDRDEVQAAYDAIEDGDLSSYALSEVLAVGGEYVDVAD